MDCPKCKSTQRKKNGFRRGKQLYKCKSYGKRDIAKLEMTITGYC